MSKKGEILALEGVCCAGKTTIVKQLAAHFKAGVVPELPEFGRNLFRPFADGEAILYNGNRSIEIEKVRMLGAIGLSKIVEHVILDRSFLSTLALGYGAIDLVGTSGYRGLTEKVLSAMESEELPLPDKTLYISVDGQTVSERNETRVPKLDGYWVDPRRVERQNAFYESISVVDGIEIVDGARDRGMVLEDCIERSQDSPVASSEDVVLAIKDFMASPDNL